MRRGRENTWNRASASEPEPRVSKWTTSRRYLGSDRGIVARAALHTHTRDISATRHDLDETLTLAIRCGFSLHEADAHLGYARLALAESDPASALLSLASARSIIDATGYHRRDEELTTLEAEATTMAAAIDAAP